MCATEVIRLFFTIVLGIFLAYVAYQQHLTNRNKLKLDLYNKRFEVYKDTLRFYQELTNNELLNETHLNFITSKNASYHLFANNREIFNLLEEIHKESFKVIGFRDHGAELDDSPDEKHEMHQKSLSVLSWLDTIMPDLREKMSEYLDQKIV